MGKAMKYVVLGFKNALGSLTFEDFGGYEYGDLSKKVSRKKIQFLEEAYSEKQQTNKKSKQLSK